MWRRISRSPLAQVMVCCLSAPSHYLSQYWFIIGNVPWNSNEINFTATAQAIFFCILVWNYALKLLPYFPGAYGLDNVTLDQPRQICHLILHGWYTFLVETTEIATVWNIIDYPVLNYTLYTFIIVWSDHITWLSFPVHVCFKYDRRYQHNSQINIHPYSPYGYPQHISGIRKLHTVRYRYNTVIFLENPQNRYPYLALTACFVSSESDLE